MSRVTLLAAMMVIHVLGPGLASASPIFQLSWGTPGQNAGEFANPSDVAIGPNGQVYVADASNNRIQTFSATGSFQGQWSISLPTAIAVSPDGSVYVGSSTSFNIQKFSSDGTHLLEWGANGSDDGEFQGAISGIAIAGDKTIYVVDGNCRVQKFSENGQFLGKWGSSGQGDGQFLAPLSIALDVSGNVYVGDQAPWIQKFTSDGSLLSRFTLTSPYTLSVPGLAVDANGQIYVVESDTNKVIILSSDGTPTDFFGAPGTYEGAFQSPSAIALDGSGNLYVVDAGNERVQKFSYSTPTRRSTWGTLKARFQE